MRGRFLDHAARFAGLCAAALSVTATTLPPRATAQEGQRGEPGVAALRDVANFSELTRRPASPPASQQGPAHKPRPRASLAPVAISRAAPEVVLGPPGPPGEAVLLPAGAPLPSPPPSASFLALLDDGTQFDPDTSGAVGPNHLMVALNSQMRIMTRAGETNSTITLNSFWANVGGLGSFTARDPRLLYDPYGQRWIHTARGYLNDTNGGLLVAVSQTSDPTGQWNRYYVGVTTNQPFFPSSPQVGFNTNWIAVQVTTYSNESGIFAGSDIYVFNKANLYAGGSGSWRRFAQTNANDDAYVAAPATTYDPTNQVLYLLSNFNGDYLNSAGERVGTLRVFSISGPVGAEVFSEGALADNDPLYNPPWESYSPTYGNFAPQFGTTNRIDTGDARIKSVVFRNGSLWAAHTIFTPLDNPTRSAVQWWDITPGLGQVIQRGRVEDLNSFNFFAFPSIATSANNDVVVGYTSFSPGQYPSAHYGFRRETDLFSTLRANTQLKFGEAKYATDDDGLTHWGDWSATTVDPANDTDIWTLQEFASTPVAGTDRWGTWWGRISPPRDLGVTQTDAPDPVFAGSNLTYTVTVKNNSPFYRVPGVKIVDALPPGALFVSATPSQGACAFSNNAVRCEFGYVDGSNSVTATIVVIPTLAGPNTNTVVASSSGPETTPDDNTSALVTTVNASANLALSLTGTPNPVSVGSNLTYFVLVTNRGPSTASGVTLTNTLPASVTWLSATPSQGSCNIASNVLTCTLGSVVTNGSATVSILVRAAFAGLLTNRASVGTTATDPNKNDNSATNVVRANALPTMQVLANRSVNEDVSTGLIDFTVGDVETPAASLVVTASSSNPLIVPNAGLTLGGSGTNRTISILPAANANGVVTITRTVTDGDGASVSSTFTLTVNAVNDPPMITDILNQTINEDAALGSLAFTVGDVESPATSLTVAGASSNPTLVPNANVVFGGSGSSRTVTVTPAANQFGTATITVTVTDPGAASTNDMFTLTVTSVNDLPTISDVVNQTVNEDTPTAALAVTVNDLETPLASLTLSASSSNPALVPVGNVAFGGSGGSRTVTVTPAANQTGAATVTVTVTDADGGSTNDTFVLTVNPVNDPPAIDTISNVTILEDAGLQTVNLTGVTSGAADESQTLTVSATSSAPALIPHPAVSYTSANSTGSLSFTPAPNSNGAVTITVTVNDGGASNNVTTRAFTVNVTPVNDAPTLVSTIPAQTINEDASVGPLGFTVGDVETAAASLTVSGGSSNTNLVPNANVTFGGGAGNRTVSVTPAANQSGTATITIMVSDGATNAVASFLLTVNPVNDPPTLSNIGSQSTLEDIPATIPFTVGDLETPVASLGLAGSSSNPGVVPNSGVTFGGSGASRTVILTPVADQSGTATISVVVSDGNGGSATNNFTFTVSAVNDPPTLNTNANVVMDEDSGATNVTFTGVSSGAPNETQTLIVTAASSAPSILPHPAVSYTSASAGGTLSFAPVANSNGVVTVTVAVNDGGASNNVIMRAFTVTINPLNDPPTIGSIANRTIIEDALAGPIPLAIGDLDTPAASLFLSGISSDPEVVADGDITFGGSGFARTVTVRPLAEQSGFATITITLSDGQGGTAMTSFDLTVLTSNDPPSLTAIGNRSVSEDTSTGPINFTVGDSETVATALTVSAASSNPTLVPVGNVTLGGSGANRTISILPATNQFGTAIISLIAADPDGGRTTNSFTLTVNAVNDLPTCTGLSNQSINEEGATVALPFTIGDLETSAAGLTVTGGSSNTGLVPNANVTFGGSGANRTVTVRPATNGFGNAIITVTVTDGDGGSTNTSFTLTVNPVNDLPALSFLGNLAINENASTNIPFTVGDIETPAGSLTVTAGSSNPALLPNASVVLGGGGANRVLTLTPLPAQSGVATVSVAVTDGDGGGVTNTFVLTVISVNDPPTLDAISNLTINEDAGPQTVALTGISSGAPNEPQPLVVTAASGNPSIIPHPTVTYLSPGTNGSLSFAPAANANGSVVITVTVNDGGASNNLVIRTFTVNVTPVNDPPVISDIPNQSILEDAATAALAFTIGDLETPAASLTVAGSSSNPAIVANSGIVFGGSGANRTVTVTPQPNANGFVTITVAVTDGNSATTTDNFVLAVAPVGDPPVITGLANQSINEDTTLGPVSFSLTNPDGAASALLVAAVSSNTGLVPNSAIVLGGSGASRTLTVTPLPNQSGAATITVSATDTNTGAGATSSLVLTVNPVNDVPVISGAPPLTIAEDTATGPLSIIVGDVETAAGSLTVTATSANLTLVPNANLVLGGSGPTRTLTITPAPNQSGAAVVSVTVSDGVNSERADIILTVNAVNDPPTLDALNNLTLAEDAALQTVNLAGIGAGPNESQTLTVAAVSNNPALVPNPTVNYISPNATGTLTFTPVANATGTATITVTVNDGAPSNNVVTRAFTVTVNAANDPPTISAIGAQATAEDTPLTVAFTVGDAETAALSLTVTATSTNTALVANSNVVCSGFGAAKTVTIHPTTNLFGTTLITLTVSDGAATASSSFVLTVNSVNDRPTLNPLTDLALIENAANQTINLSGITSGAGNENQTLTVTVASGNTALIPTPTVSYTSTNLTGSITMNPANSGTGTSVVSVAVSDGSLTSTQTFTVRVRLSGNALPVISTTTNRVVNEDTATGPIAFTVGDAATAASNLVVLGTSSNTNLVPNANIVFGGSGSNRTVNVTPAPNQSGTTAITLTVVDAGFGAATNIFVLTVNPVNDAPAISTIANQTINEDAATGPIAFTVSDVETRAASLTVTAGSSNTGLVPNANITLGGAGTNRALSITPVANASGAATITVTVSDGVASTSTNFLLTVNAANDLPTISDIADQAINEDSATAVIAFTVGDVETAAASLTLTGSSSNTGLVPNANIVFGGSGASRTVTVTPAANQFGTATITVTVGDGANSASDTFLLTVNAVNDAPTLDAIGNLTLGPNSPLQHVPVTGVGAGAANEAQSLTLAASSSNPSLIPNPFLNYSSPDAAGSLVLVPVAGASGSATITVTINDGAAANNTITRTFTVTVNGAPTISGLLTQTTSEDTPTAAIPFTIGDAETAAASLTMTGSSSNPGLVPNANIVFGGSGANRTVTVTPAANQSGSAAITLTVTDGNANSTNTAFVLVVSPANDAPTLAAIGNLTILEDAGVQTVNLGGIGTGAANENDTLTVTAVSSNPGLIPNPAVSYASPNGTGSLTFTPVANASGSATINVMVNDGQFLNNTVTQNFTVTVTAVNDAPTLAALGNLTINQNDGVQTVNLTGLSFGPANENQTISVTALSSNTAVITNVSVSYASPNPAGTLTFRPATNAVGAAVIAVTVMDNGGTASGGQDKVTRTFTVTVNSTNTAPPVLRIDTAGANVVVSWPDSAAGFTLQCKSTVATNQAWSAVATTPALSGGRFWVTNAPTGGAKFYRLFKPAGGAGGGGGGSASASVSAGPTLSILRSHHTVKVSWPAAPAGFVLESAPSLRNSVWTAVTSAPLSADGLNTVTLNASGGARFFRLRVP